MQFFIANTFLTALGKLDNISQKSAKTCAFELQMDPTGKGKQVHRIDKAKEKNFWSVRAGRDIRLIIHKTGDRTTLCYVGHHDDAYAWAERRVFERHPVTGALQIVEMVERVAEAPVQATTLELLTHIPQTMRPPTSVLNVGPAELMSYGVPKQWVDALLRAGEERLLELAAHLPDEASEAVLALAVGEKPIRGKEYRGAQIPDSFVHPDEQRRFRVIEGKEELEQALDYPRDQWSVFLHPSQREFVDRDFQGPARIAGSAGTGKTVVALHRAHRLSKEPGTKILLTTFSRPLASALSRKVGILDGNEDTLAPNIHVASFVDAASDLYELMSGHKPYLVNDARIKALLLKHGPDEDQTFLWSEWQSVIDAWQVASEEDYLDIARIGRRSRVPRGQRARMWPVFAAVRQAIISSDKLTEPMLFGLVEASYLDKPEKPYTHTIVDEAQDLDVAELKFLAAITPDTDNALFFAGDLGQRIFKLPFSWKSLGVDVRGRSATLKVNYRTSHQVRMVADKLLPEVIRDMDGLEEDRGGTISVFNGPAPDIRTFESQEAEIKMVASWIQTAINDETPLSEIGIFVRSEAALTRARAVADMLGVHAQTLNEKLAIKEKVLPIGTMQLAKGLEFRSVVVMACDDDQLPLQSRIESIVTEEDLDEVYTTERHLLYVACTRARENLLVTGVKPESDFLADLV